MARKKTAEAANQAASVFICDRYPRLIVYGPTGRIGRFEDGWFETDDPEAIKVLEGIPEVSKE